VGGQDRRGEDPPRRRAEGPHGSPPATIRHTYRGDLQIDLVAPDGSLYRLKSSSNGDSADDVVATYTVNASSQTANGTWRLQVYDRYSGDTGRIDSWGLQF
jgi:subtilisin-like proprotein convertase family protein